MTVILIAAVVVVLALAFAAWQRRAVAAGVAETLPPELRAQLELPQSEWAPAASPPRGQGPAGAAIADLREQLRPLGIEVVDWVRLHHHPTFESRTTYRGENEWRGRRHGRDLVMRFGADRMTIELTGSYPSFQLQGQHDRLRATGPVPDGVADALANTKPSPLWNGLTVGASADGLRLRRRTGSGGSAQWAHDLLLAERVADAAAS